MRTFVFACLIAVALPSISQEESIALKGLVLNPAGKPIENAFVLLRDYRQTGTEYMSHRWETRTAADGSFTTAVPRDCYDLFVSANAQFLPFSGRICVQAELRTLTIKLKADPHTSIQERPDYSP